MKRHLIDFTKLAIALGIIAVLLWHVHRQDPEQFRRLWAQSKDWPRLTVALGLVMGSVCLTFVRWYVLVRALGLDFRMKDAFRLGFLGYLIGAGSVSGDLFKGVFIARSQPGRRTEAVATVLLDRIIGLYVLLVVASLAILASDRSRLGPVVGTLCDVTLLVTLGGTMALGLMFGFRYQQGPLFDRLCRLPAVGRVFERLASALQMYRRKPGALALAAVLSLLVHVSFPVAIYLVGASLFSRPPALVEHFVIVPLSSCAAAFPTPGGLGTFELSMDQLYKLMAVGTDAEGVIVALAYRLMALGIAALGVVYYLVSRYEVRTILEEAAEFSHAK